LIERFPGERWWPTLVLIYSPQQILVIPSVLLAAYFIRFKKWSAAIITILPAGLILMMLLGAPIQKNTSDNPSDLRILTWNLYRGQAGPSLPEMVTHVWPDVICIQEGTPWSRKHLEKMLDKPQFRGWYSTECGELIILSRLPMKRLGTTHSALWASVDVNGEEVVIINAHFTAPFDARISDLVNPAKLNGAVRLRNKQTSQILDQLPTDKPAVLCGDLNTPPNSAIYRILKSEMIDAFMETGSGFGLSYYRKLPLVRIDHIMVTPNITPVRCWMPKTAVSNHKPVCADLDI